MHPVDQAIGHFALEIDVHEGQVRGLFGDQPVRVGRVCGRAGHHHSHPLECGLQRFGDVPRIFHDQDPQAP